MIPDGLYGVQFHTSVGEGQGVVVVTGDEVRGGDAAFAYFGRIIRNDKQFSVRIKTKRHAEGRPSVFGRESVNILLTGHGKATTAIALAPLRKFPDFYSERYWCRLRHNAEPTEFLPDYCRVAHKKISRPGVGRSSLDRAQQANRIEIEAANRGGLTAADL